MTVVVKVVPLGNESFLSLRVVCSSKQLGLAKYSNTKFYRLETALHALAHKELIVMAMNVSFKFW
jgi:hypothetical protein